MLRLAFRNLFRQKARTAMTLAAVTLGVVGVIVSGGFVEDIFFQLREVTIHSRLGHLQVFREGYHAFHHRDPFGYLIEEPVPLVAELRAEPGVTSVMQRVNLSGLLSNGRTDLPVVGEGVEPGPEAELASFLYLVAGRQLGPEDPYGVLVGEGVAHSLQLTPGDYVTLMANTREGSLNTVELQVVGVFRTFSRDFDMRAVRLPLGTAQDLLATPAIHSVVLSLGLTEATDQVAARLRTALGPRGFSVMTWLELDDFYPKTVSLYRRQFGVLQGIILAIVLLSVTNSVSMTAYERVGEFGTLRALGRRSAHVFRMVVLENALIGAGGVVLGLALGTGLAALASTVGIPMPPPPNANMGYTAHVRTVPHVLALAAAIGFLAAVLAAVLAGRGASRVSIPDALRQNV
jgi:putative ABC transport system permease protein